MNGTLPNGDAGHDQHQTPDLSHILRALEVVYNPRATNTERKDATIFLDDAKQRSAAPSQGFSIALDHNRPPVARHYGLSVLEYAIKYKWADYSEEDTRAMRDWIIQLARSVTEEDALFIRNKIAQLWVEVAKRCWVADWLNMDELLVEMWSKSLVHRGIVLHVLETLSEEVFSKEDPVAGLRGNELGKACVEIMTPPAVLAEAFPAREFSYDVRHGEDGWLQRILSLLEWCLDNGLLDQAGIQTCALQLLAVLRSVMSWIILRAVARSPCAELICRCLSVPNVAIQMAAVEVMHALYHRTHFQDEEVVELVCPLLTTDGVALLQRFYTISTERVQQDLQDIDDARYTLLKKFSEVICALGSFIEQKAATVEQRCDIPAAFQFFVNVLQHQSLVVSIPVLYLWTKLLASRSTEIFNIVAPMIGTLLETCSPRLLRYELLNMEESNDPTILFLLEDFDTMPERHAFVGNYRRFSMEVIERVVRKSPIEAVHHILQQADSFLQQLYNEEKKIDTQDFKSNSPPVLQFDAQSTVVMTALKGFVKSSATSDHSEASSNMRNALKEWCMRLIKTSFSNPVLEKRMLQLVVEITTTVLPSRTDLLHTICNYILSTPSLATHGFSLYDDAVRDLQCTKPRELQKLAIESSREISSFFVEVETGVNQLINSTTLDQRVKLDYQAFLFIIVHRSPEIDDDERRQRMQSIVRPILDQWADSKLSESLSSFESFCQLIGLDQFPTYFMSMGAQNIHDWASQQLDNEGQVYRDRLSGATDALPLQSLRSLLSVSTDRVREGSKEYVSARELWREAVPIILPNLLRFVGYAHSFNNVSSWRNSPNDMELILKRILVDRVWQSGISSESRDDFYARVRDSKVTLEGLASAVRGAVRNVRELCYWILHCMSQFGDIFYNHYDLPEPLARALYTDARTLSPHQLSALLKLSAAIVEGCPPENRHHFLPPILTSLFKQLDRKIGEEWDNIEKRRNDESSGGSLDQEMKAESVLRQLTHSAVLFVSNLLDPPKTTSHSHATEHPTVRTLIIQNPDVLESLILFCTHALRMHDSRCCGIITRVLKSLIPEFATTSTSPSSPSATTLPDAASNGPVSNSNTGSETAAQVREFISTEVLKACITSLHEPYFADLQRDLASLIATILVLYSPSTATPRSVILSLPGMHERKVDEYLAGMRRSAAERQQRAWVLNMLESVRGVSIHEQGKIAVSKGRGGEDTKTKKRSAMQEQFMSVDDTGIKRGGSPEPGAVADLFG